MYGREEGIVHHYWPWAVFFLYLHHYTDPNRFFFLLGASVSLSILNILLFSLSLFHILVVILTFILCPVFQIKDNYVYADTLIYPRMQIFACLIYLHINISCQNHRSCCTAVDKIVMQRAPLVGREG